MFDFLIIFVALPFYRVELTWAILYNSQAVLSIFPGLTNIATGKGAYPKRALNNQISWGSVCDFR